MKNKLIIFISLLFPTLMLADYTFTVENTAMVNTYFNIFNAIAALLSSNDYLDLLRLTFLLGGFFVFAGSVLTAWEGSANAKILSPYGKYLIVGVALLTLVFSQKETIWVTTDNLPSFCSNASPTTGTAVSMPSILGFVFSTTNKIGRGLTELAESAFSSPSASGTASMSDSGGYLGSLKETIKLLSLNANNVTLKDGTSTTSSSDFTTLWSKFFNTCVYSIANNKGAEGDAVLNEMVSSKNLYDWVQNYLTYTYDGVATQVGDSLIEWNGRYVTCTSFFGILDNSVAELTSKYNCAYPLAHGGVLELLTGSTGGTSSDLNMIAVQSGIINALSASKNINSIGISGANFADGKSRAESSQQNLASAQYMAQMLPFIQMTMRAILYAFFPFVFVVMLLPGGLKVLAQYGQTMLWIELWGPTAAVVNMFVNMQVQATIGDQYSKTGLTYLSSIDMLGEANTIAGVGAMLYLSIPALTWLILKGSGQMLGNVAGGVMSTFSKNLDSKTIKQDMTEKNELTALNNRRNEEGLKAISFGEMQHYQARMQGMKSAAETMANMNTGVNNASNKIETDIMAQNLATEQKINSMTKDGYVNSTVAKDLKNALTDQNHLTQTGMLNGNTINNNKVSELSKTDAAAQAIQTLTNNKDYKKWAELNHRDLNNINTMNDYTNQLSNVKSNENIFGNENKRQEQIKTNVSNKDGSMNSNGTTEKANILSEQEKNKYEIEKGTQKINNSDKIIDSGIFNNSTQIKTNEILNKNLGGDIDNSTNRLASVNAQKLETDTKSTEKFNILQGGQKQAVNNESSANSLQKDINVDVMNSVVEKENLDKIKKAAIVDQRTKIETTDKTTKLLGGEDKAVEKVSDADSTRKSVSTNVTNKINEKLGMKNMEDAAFRKEAVDIMSENKKENTIEDESTRKSSEEDSKTWKHFEESKNQAKFLINDIHKGTEAAFNKSIEKYKEAGFSENESKILAGNDYVFNLAKKGFYNENITKAAYMNTMKGLENKKNNDIAKLDNIKDSDKIAKIKDEYFNNIKKLDKTFTDLGALKIDSVGNTTYRNSATDVLNNKGTNENDKEIRKIISSFEGNTIKGTDVYGYQTIYSKNELNGTLTSKQLSAQTGMNLSGAKLDLSYISAMATDKSYESLFGIAVTSKALEEIKPVVVGAISKGKSKSKSKSKK